MTALSVFSMPKKTPEITPEPPIPPLVPQPHGGAIHAGGKPHNVGGAGRPASAIRAKLRGSFARRIKILEEIADGGTENAKFNAPDRLKAIDLLAKYGLGTTKELTVEHIRERLSDQIRAINAAFPADEAEKILSVIEPVWRTK